MSRWIAANGAGLAGIATPRAPRPRRATLERGSNENMNGLIRLYLPKGASMEQIRQAGCDPVAD